MPAVINQALNIPNF